MSFVSSTFALDMLPYLGCVFDCNQPNLNNASISSYNEPQSEAKFTHQSIICLIQISPSQNKTKKK